MGATKPHTRNRAQAQKPARGRVLLKGGKTTKKQTLWETICEATSYEENA